jgi:hypothetical protein
MRSSPSYAIVERSLAFRREAVRPDRVHASYVSKVGRGSVVASRSFAESADQHLRAGKALVRRWKQMRDALAGSGTVRVRHEEAAGDGSQPAPESELVVDHELAELAYRDGVYRAVIWRLIRNTGAQRPLR